MALFKIFQGSNTNKLINKSDPTYIPPVDGYAYYDTSTKLFYIDAKYPDPTNEEADLTEENYYVPNILGRYPINAYGAQKAYSDEDGNPIVSTYLKISDTGSYLSGGTIGTLRFGANNAFVFDGSEDVTVPVYDGTYTL